MKTKVPLYSGLISDDERQALLDTARKYLGVRWQHLGRNVHGLDCVGLLIMTVQDVLGTAPQVWDYPVWPNPQLMRDICNKCMVAIKREDMRPGDAALMYAPGLGVVHLGWFTGKTMIHASNEPHAMKVVETTIHPDWSLRGAYAVPRYREK